MAQIDRRGLRERGLGEPLDTAALLLQQCLEAVEEHVATRLADVEQSDPHAVERLWPWRTRPGDNRLQLAGGVEEFVRGGRHVQRTSLVTISLPISPLAQPPMTAENIPASPPAWTMSRPPSRNFG